MLAWMGQTAGRTHGQGVVFLLTATASCAVLRPKGEKTGLLERNDFAM